MIVQKKATFVFIIGVPRSGTSWLFNMVADHHKIKSLNGSNTFLHKYIFALSKTYEEEKKTFLKKGFDRGVPSKLNSKEFDILLNDYVSRFYNFLSPQDKFYVEKATDVTSELNEIRRFIPNSKFIHIIRDGRNSTISRIKNRKKYGRPFGVTNLIEGAEGWKKQIHEARQNSVEFSEDILELKYEDLLSETPIFLKKIFDHIGAPTSYEDILDICENNNIQNKKLSNPNSRVINELGKAEAIYEKEMSRNDLFLFNYIAGDLLRSLNYPVKNTNYFEKFIVKGIILPVYMIKSKLIKALALLKKAVIIF